MTEKSDPSTLREVLKIWGPVILLTLIGFAVALRFVGAPPPEEVRIGTGAAGGEYAVAGELFAERLRAADIRPILVESAGSSQNLARLRAGELDIALVQGGVAQASEEGLAGVASLYLEPLWIFAREPLGRIDALAGKRVQLGAPGSGTRALAERLCAAADLALDEFEVHEDPPALALRSLLAGAVDAVWLVAAPRSELVRELLAAGPAIVPSDFERADGIARNLTFLEPVHIPAGSVDLGADQPAAPLATVAPAATLIANEDLHPAVISLFVEAAKERYGARGVLENAGQFPSLALLDVAPTLAARHAIEKGPSFLFRVLPFQVAATVDRLKILLLPLVTLLLPLFRVAPPLLRWRSRRRILLWYKRVLALEKRLRESDLSPAELSASAAELDRFDGELAGVKIPLSYVDELYHLRLHLRMVREDLTKGRGRWSERA